jgi:hypothetical protein
MKKILLTLAIVLTAKAYVGNEPSVASPIAPTPTCLPGDPKGCPSQDWGK